MAGVASVIRAGYGARSDDSLGWALRRSPIFRQDLSAVAEVGGNVVGCWLSSVQDLKIAPGFFLRAGSGLVVVHPECRRMGIGTNLYSWRRSLPAGKEAVLGYGVASPETRRLFWSRVSGSPVVPDCGVTFTKILSTRVLEQSLASFQAKSKDSGIRMKLCRPIHVRVDVSGIVPFCLSIEDEGFSVSEKEVTADILVEGEVESANLRSMLVSLARRRLRISGRRHLLRLFPLLRVLRTLARVMSDSLSA